MSEDTMCGICGLPSCLAEERQIRGLRAMFARGFTANPAYVATITCRHCGKHDGQQVDTYDPCRCPRP